MQNLNAPTIPSLQPYNVTPYFYTGTESLSTTFISRSNDIADWVLVEIKNPTTNTVIIRRAAILRTDGNITDSSKAVNGSSANGLEFSNINLSGNYVITLRHRNHIGISTSNPINITPEATINIDFTNNLNVKNNNQITIGNNSLGQPIYGLRSGDVNHDGSIDSADRNLLRSSNEALNTYSFLDLNLDGTIDSLDRTYIRLAPEAIESL
jgi:hypothetical protein